MERTATTGNTKLADTPRDNALLTIASYSQVLIKTVPQAGKHREQRLAILQSLIGKILSS